MKQSQLVNCFLCGKFAGKGSHFKTELDPETGIRELTLAVCVRCLMACKK